MSATATVVRLASIDWVSKAQDLDSRGWALLPRLITRDQCREISELYARAAGFRSRVVMSRHGFGRGEYQYFAYPLPDLVQALRTSLYPSLVPIANAWHERMGLDVRFPPTHAEFIERCRHAGQARPQLGIDAPTTGGAPVVTARRHRQDVPRAAGGRRLVETHRSGMPVPRGALPLCMIRGWRN